MAAVKEGEMREVGKEEAMEAVETKVAGRAGWAVGAAMAREAMEMPLLQASRLPAVRR